MQTVRQVASGLVYAVVSLLLVIGSLALSLAQSPGAPAATSTQAIATNTLTSTQTSQPTASGIAITPSGTGTRAATSTPVATTASATAAPEKTAVSSTSRPIPTSTSACGPSTGWVRSYVVQPGDTLFRIASMHGIRVEILQRANCKTGTLIYAGEKLWVPFALPAPTALTIIPTFPTPTDEATPTSSPTPTTTATN